MISFYILSKIFFLKHKRLSNERVASITKREYGFALHFLKRFIKPLKSRSNEWLSIISWSSRLFEMFLIKYCVEFSLTFLVQENKFER